jgi:hypothetical protein
MGALLASFASVPLLVVVVVACGGASAPVVRGVRAATSGVGYPPHNNLDDDSEEDRGHQDSDDVGIVFLGHVANPNETAMVVALIKRYYEAAAAEDGHLGCSLLAPAIAESVVEDYGRPPGPPALRGGTCAVVVSKVYRQRHRRLVAGTARLHVVQVRTSGSQGLALLTFGSTFRRYLPLRRHRGAWKVASFFDIEMP